MKKKNVLLDEKETQKLESITAYELMDKTRELHTKITSLIMESDLPPITVIGVLDSVKNSIFNYVDFISTIETLNKINKKKGGDE